MDQLFLRRGESGEHVAEGVFDTLGVVAVGPAASEPAQHEVVIASSRNLVGFRCAVGLEVVSGVLEGGSALALEVITIPLSDLGVR